jgi:sigma-B regulation protein RsbU (phosphoserine phosphatase)
LQLRGDRVESLEAWGTVIGPLPEVVYRRGHARVEPGAVLLLATDGILERVDGSGEALGEPGLIRIARERLDASAAEILEHVLREAQRHGGDRVWEDDATVVVVKRLPIPEEDRRMRSKEAP